MGTPAGRPAFQAREPAAAPRRCEGPSGASSGQSRRDLQRQGRYKPVDRIHLRQRCPQPHTGGDAT